MKEDKFAQASEYENVLLWNKDDNKFMKFYILSIDGIDNLGFDRYQLWDDMTGSYLIFDMNRAMVIAKGFSLKNIISDISGILTKPYAYGTYREDQSLRVSRDCYSENKNKLHLNIEKFKADTFVVEILAEGHKYEDLISLICEDHELVFEFYRDLFLGGKYSIDLPKPSRSVKISI